MRSRYTFVMSTFLLFVALSATNVFAVTITPVKMEITCQPGEQTAVYYDAYNKSAESIGVNVSAILSAAELPVAVFFSSWLLAEKVSLLQWVGIAIILSAIVISNLSKKKKTEGIVQ